MTLQDAIHVLRLRWITVVVVAVIATGVAVAYAWLAPPTYTGSTDIFIATPNASDPYAAATYAQQRTVAYTDLITSESLAMRTVQRLDLDFPPRTLARKIEASANKDSVVITLSVKDSSPTRAVSLANDLSEDFVRMVQELEAPPETQPEGRQSARAVIVQPAAAEAELTWPQREKIITFGIGAGLLLGAVVALVRGRPENEDEMQDSAATAHVDSSDVRWGSKDQLGDSPDAPSSRQSPQADDAALARRHRRRE